MAKIDSGSKSSRLLASRRYTHDTYTTAQEAFTEVLDLGASEIYTQASKIPSSGLPFSGSSQSGSYYTVNNENILKYYYRHKLTKSNLNNETWFILGPTGSDSGIGAQLINDDQEVNFVSPKYSISSLANSITEDSTPGYLAVLYKSSDISGSAQTGSLVSGDKVSTNDYILDYKTGVLQFMNSAVDPTDNDYLYMTVYQYVGTTLNTGLEVTGNTTFGDAHTDIHRVTGSLKLDSTLFDIYDDSDELMFKIQNKMAVLGTIGAEAPPSAQAGGLYYSGSDQWFLGYSGDPT